MLIFSFFVLLARIHTAELTNSEHLQPLIPEQHSIEMDHHEPFDIKPRTYEALAVVVKKIQGKVHNISLPEKATESKGQIEYSELEDPNETIEYLCPAEDLMHKHHVAANQYASPKVEYCLFDHMWDSNQSRCEREVNPLFTLKEIKDRDGTPLKCGSTIHHQLYAFGFMYCTSEDQGFETLPKITSSLLGIYEVCFDTYNSKTLFTKHDVRTGPMLQSPGLPSQKPHFSPVLGTQHFHLPDDNAFSNTKEEYEKQKKDESYIMKPQMLVPEDDIALNVWKKTTHHILNTEPLWDKLIPLMKAINDGIRKAAIIVDMKNYEKEPQPLPHHVLHIFTRTTTFSHLSWPWRIYNALINFFTQNEDEPFGLNIWCKFVYYPLENEGIMIYVHNLPANPPEMVNTTPDDPNQKPLLKEKECETPIRCDFKMWTDESTRSSLSDELLAYAYCCEVNYDKIKQLFLIEFENEDVNVLDIDDIVNEDKF